MNTGGPAFPCPVGHIECAHPEGMTLRDYFAAKAMVSYIDFAMGSLRDDPEGFLSNKERAEKTLREFMQSVPEKAYDIADLMLAERSKQ